jgi:acyl-CoA dehydrogenase
MSADEQLLSDVRQVAGEFAAANADSVDREARFPTETIDALREVKALSALIPAEHGGGGASFEAVAEACFELGRRCGSSAMVFAMHQIQVAVIVRHLDSGWFEGYLRQVAEDQRLIASVTSEVGTGGDMGRSIAAVEEGDHGSRTFVKEAPTASYAAHADDYLTTVRRSPDADGGEQVIVLSRGENTELEQNGTWDTLGMRGTCSPSFTVRASFAPEQILATPFSAIAVESMVPCSHILWSHLWLGIATDAFDRARAFVRAAAKRSGGAPTPAGARLSHLMSELSLLRAEVSSALAEFLVASEEPGRPRLSTMASALRFNNLKIAASEQAPRVCQGAMAVTGVVGYKNDTPFSVGRHLRDTLSAPLMIANERIHQTNAGLLLIAKDV